MADNKQDSNSQRDDLNATEISDEQRFRQLKSIQNYVTASIILALISVLIGGVILSTIALIFGFLAFHKIRPLIEPDMESDDLPRRLWRQAVVGIALSALMLVLNAIALCILLPTMFEIIQSGDYEHMFSNLINGTAGTSASGSSIWG